MKKKELPNLNQKFKLQEPIEFQECISNVHPFMSMRIWSTLKKLVGWIINQKLWSNWKSHQHSYQYCEFWNLGWLCPPKPIPSLRKMVDVDVIPPKPLHIYYNNIFALQIYIHSHLSTNSKQTSICSPSIHHIHDYFS
jgi:hypothetical protein